MDVKLIKTAADHASALEEVDRLIALDPKVGSEEGDKLELLTHLIDEYEGMTFPIGLPDPISAIEFVMDQKGLTQRDLIPFIGSRSRVSEVLSGKRKLSLSMMKVLHKEMGIPAEIFLQKSEADFEEADEIEWDQFPLKEMIRRGWIKESYDVACQNAEELIHAFLQPIGGYKASPVLYRKKLLARASRVEDPYALEAWRGGVMRKASEMKAEPYRSNLIDFEFLTNISKFSRPHKGPLLVRDFLLSFGICLVVESHFPKTYLDGASFLTPDGNPIVALTLRYDRIDHFWFVLLHELVHVWRHLKQGRVECIVDDLDIEAPDQLEEEADKYALEALIPSNIWESSDAHNLQSSYDAIALADQLKIHPAIVAGRIRHESKNFRKLNHLVGHGEVGQMFS